MTKRNIETKYIISNTEVKVTRSSHPFNAVERCIRHMQRNDYGADYAEVWNLDTGKVYAQITFHKDGRISIWRNASRADLLLNMTL